jgi:hypothetical protein
MHQNAIVRYNTQFFVFQTFSGMDAQKFPNFWNCSLDISSWEQLFELYHRGDYKYGSGGLGPSRVYNIYLSWVCMKGTLPWPSRSVCIMLITLQLYAYSL